MIDVTHQVKGDTLKHASRKAAAVAVLVALLGFSHHASAADTVETWAVGATDVDFYLGMDGLGLPSAERSIYGDMMLGYGLVEGFSAYLGTTLEGADAFSTGASSHYLGIFGTPLDSDHLDLDLFLDVSSGGFEQQFQLRPAVELNVDHDPEMNSWGFYLRAPMPVYGRKLDSGETHTRFHLESTLGAYARIAPSHQLLLEFDMAVHPDPVEGERRTDVGGVAIGYNVTLSDTIELINQVYVDIPQRGEEASAGVMTGFIASLPSAGEQQK